MTESPNEDDDGILTHPVFLEPKTKVCPLCGREKPASEFYKNAKSKDGLQGRCKECTKSNSAMYYTAFKDEIARKRKANAEYLNAYQRKYRQEHPDKVANGYKYYADHRDEILERRRNRYARTRTTEEKALSNIELYDSFTCAECGKTFYVLKSTIRSYHKQGRPDPKYCCRECSNIGRRKTATANQTNSPTGE